MKASVSVALVIAGVCLAGRARAQTVVVGPQAGSMALLPGTQVTVPIVADMSGSGGASLGSVTARLLWQPGVLAFRGVSGGTLGQPVVNADSAGGSLRFALAYPAGATGQPVLLSATFAVVGAAGARDSLRVQLQELSRAGTFADLLGIGTATSAQLCVSTGLYGDLNADGLINSFDALVIVTSAVGLPIAPNTTVNGDVDGDGQVSTRDALIVLSYAIALPVNGFRVSRINAGGCAVQAPASVHIQPAAAAVAVGDQFPLTATVRDSGNAVVQSVGLVWTSADTAVVKTDATGHLVATKAGSTFVFAFASPGLKDSIPVTVDSLRHVWWVNPALAALNGGVELGSQTYPFAGIGQAVARAAAGDSVHVAPATYGDTVRLTRGLTVLGDSTAAGMPLIRNPAGPGIAVGPLGGGFVRLAHLRIEDSQGGVVANGADSVLISSVYVARSHGAGISVSNVGRLAIDHSSVEGAVGQAISVTAVPRVRLHAVFTDVVSRAGFGGGVPPYGLWVSNADSVVGDSLALLTAGIWVDSARVALLEGIRTAGTDGPGIAARVGAAFTLDSADIADASGSDSVPAVVVSLSGGSATARVGTTLIRHSGGRTGLGIFGGDSALVSGVVVQNVGRPSLAGLSVAFFQGMRRIVVHGSSFLDNGDGQVLFQDGTHVMQASVDSSQFRSTVLVASGLASLTVLQSTFQNDMSTPVTTSGVPLVSLVGIEQSGIQAQNLVWPYGGAFGIDVTNADSLYLGGLYLHDNPYGAVICRSCRAVRADSSTFLRNGQYPGYLGYTTMGTLVLEGPKQAGLYGMRFDGRGVYGVLLRTAGRGGQFTIDSSTFVGDSMALVHAEPFGPDSGLGDSLAVTRSAFHGRTGYGTTGVEAYNTLSGLTVRGSTFDTTATGIGLFGTTTPLAATIAGNTFAGTTFGALSASNVPAPVVFDSNTVGNCAAGPGVQLYAVSARITGNRIAGCENGVNAVNPSASGAFLVVRGDTVRRDSLNWGESLHLEGQYDSVLVVGNRIQGGQGTGLYLNGSYAGIAAARVDSNIVQGMQGDGVRILGTVTPPVLVTYNVFADNDTNGLTATVPVSGRYNTVLRNAQIGVYDASTTQDTFRLSNYAGNGHYGVYKAAGPGFVVADSSYWGRSTGPRCFTGCDTVVAGGDSIGIAPYAIFAPIDSVTVVGAPADPVPLPAPAFRAVRRAAVLPPRSLARPAARPRPTVSVPPRRVKP